MTTASELEVQLRELIGEFPGFGNRHDRIDIFNDRMLPKMRRDNPDVEAGELSHRYQKACEAALPLLRKWWVAKGVPEKIVFGQSDFVLKNGYKGGDSYLTVVKSNPDNNKSRIKGGGGGRAVPIDIDLLNSPIGQDLPAPAPMSPQIATVSATEIRKAVDTVATPYLNSMRAEQRTLLQGAIDGFGPSIDRKIEEEVAKLELGDKLTDEVRHIATEAAKQMAEQMLPMRIELKVNGEIKQLRAEPRHEKFDEIVRWHMLGKHVYAVGPKGAGKTHLMNQICDALKVFFNDPNYTAFFIDQSLTKYDVKGFKGPDGKYIDTLVRRCVEHGGYLCIDEGDMWAAAALGSLNSILANKFGAFPDDMVPVHKNFRCILAANTIGQGASRGYVGRNPLDAASIDRFKFVPVDYDRKMERQIFAISKRREIWMEYVWRLRDACHASGNPDLEPSMRAMEDIDGLDVGLTMDQIMYGSIWKGNAPDKIQKILHHAGQPPTFQGAPIPTPQPNGRDEELSDLMDNFRIAAMNAKKVEAIKILRDHKKMQLIDAKILTESYMDGLKTLEEVFA